MSTQPSIASYLLSILGPEFSVRAMFGEYALYANGKTVGFICGDMLFVKILPASSMLESLCEKGEPYPGARSYYILEEEKWKSIADLKYILLDIAATLPSKNLKKKNTQTA